MPLQNKVDPFGAIKAEQMRGLFMGNRGGRMHDAASRTLLPGKNYVSRQWITCLTEFKGRKRKLMGEGTYTELFFLDEVVALAAGHRPCAECRRADYKRYCTTMKDNSIKAPELDKRLQGERLSVRSKASEIGPLPDGAMISIGAVAYAKRGAHALPFSFAGYGAPLDWDNLVIAEAQVLTPATSLLALRNDYKPIWHPSAGA